MNVPLPGQYATNEHVRGFYLREWGRFLHNNLDNAPSLVNPDKGNSLSIDFRASWKDNIDPLHNDIMEFDNGKGLQVNTILHMIRLLHLRIIIISFNFKFLIFRMF